MFQVGWDELSGLGCPTSEARPERRARREQGMASAGPLAHHQIVVVNQPESLLRTLAVNALSALFIAWLFKQQ